MQLCQVEIVLHGDTRKEHTLFHIQFQLLDTGYGFVVKACGLLEFFINIVKCCFHSSITGDIFRRYTGLAEIEAT